MTTFMKAKLQKSDDLHRQIWISCKDLRTTYCLKVNFPKSHHSKFMIIIHVKNYAKVSKMNMFKMDVRIVWSGMIITSLKSIE